MPSSLRLPNFTQQAYRYGIALSCIGVLINWLGVAQPYIEPVRYLGVGLVIIGSFLIIAAMCRWMFLSPNPSTVHEVRDVNSEGTGDLHVITVPMGRSNTHSRAPGTSTASLGKPPDYFLVAEKPPSYEEAMSMLPPCRASQSGVLQLNADGGLEDFLTPHQVPEHYLEGATGGGSPQPQCPRSENVQSGGQETPLSPPSPPPAYSSQMSLSASPCSSNYSNRTSPEMESGSQNISVISRDTDNDGQPHVQEVQASEQHKSAKKGSKQSSMDKSEKVVEITSPEAEEKE
ncbi:pectinesterase inhibitor 10-like [Penaeus monodon]|uniref:pectinesterase inhibitor 10-like n=1 Tax=Penaeus monodon TaxID=6687 RepID=UPI0018A77600|nr:pectinesterase inhibitor 10-like [Penaeus monodon]